MYTVYLFIVTFAVLFSNVSVSEDSISSKLDGESVSMSTDDLCTKAGFVKKEAASFRAKRNKDPIYDASTVPKMSAVDIVLTSLGVTVGVIVVAYLGNYFYNKHKVN